MSQDSNDHQPTHSLLEQCTEFLATKQSRVQEYWSLEGINQHTLEHQHETFVQELAQALEERTKGKLTVRGVAKPLVMFPLKGIINFARIDTTLPQAAVNRELVVEPQPGIMFCEINPYIKQLSAGIKYRSAGKAPTP